MGINTQVDVGGYTGPGGGTRRLHQKEMNMIEEIMEGQDEEPSGTNNRKVVV